MIIYFLRWGIIFIFSIFGQIQSFSVEFNKLTFVIVISRSCSKSYGLSVSVTFKPIFGHIDSVKLTSLYLIRYYSIIFISCYYKSLNLQELWF